MSGVAIGHNRTGRQLRGDPGELVLGTEPIGRRIVERSAVEIDRARNVTVGLGGCDLLLADEVARRASIDERGMRVVLYRGKLGKQPLIEAERAAAPKSVALTPAGTTIT